MATAAALSARIRAGLECTYDRMVCPQPGCRQPFDDRDHCGGSGLGQQLHTLGSLSVV